MVGSVLREIFAAKMVTNALSPSQLKSTSGEKGNLTTTHPPLLTNSAFGEKVGEVGSGTHISVSTLARRGNVLCVIEFHSLLTECDPSACSSNDGRLVTSCAKEN